MSRMTTHDYAAVPARVSGYGLHKLSREMDEDPYRCQPGIVRDIELVIPPLWTLFENLANKRKPWPLYLHGPAGHGKTAAVLAFCDQVVGARYWSVDRLMGTVLHNPPWEYLGVQLAVLDEVGGVRTGKGRDWDYEIVKNFFEWRQDRPTIYVSNQPLAQIRVLYDAKIFSRLASGTEYQLVDRDRRLRGRQKGEE